MGVAAAAPTATTAAAAAGRPFFSATVTTTAATMQRDNFRCIRCWHEEKQRKTVTELHCEKQNVFSSHTANNKNNNYNNNNNTMMQHKAGLQFDNCNQTLIMIYNNRANKTSNSPCTSTIQYTPYLCIYEYKIYVYIKQNAVECLFTLSQSIKAARQSNYRN